MSNYLFMLIFIVPLIALSIFFFRYRREIVELTKENREILEKWSNFSNFLETYTQEQTASEEEFKNVCNSFEDQDWVLYRNVTFHWRDGGSKTNPLKQGEIDFLLVHKNYGIVIVEVKGGRGWRFNATNNEWKIVKGEDEEIKNRGPYEQVERNKNGLGQRIYREAKKMGIKEFSPKINSFVVWTNVKSNEEQFGFVGTEDNTLYADDLTNPKELEKRILSHFTRVEMDDKNLLMLFQKILNDNIKGFSLVTHNGKITDKFEKMSQDIFRTYYEITNKLYRKIKIKGIPGSGKTFLASKLAEDEVENQKKVLFMCYNKLLGEKLEQDFNNFENIEVIIFEDFIAGLGITYDDKLMIDGKEVLLRHTSKQRETDYIMDKLNNTLEEADGKYDFDTLIIDEAQDFSPKYWSFFSELVRAKDAKWVIFYDSNQNITHDNWEEPSYLDTPPLILNTVIRSTKSIAEKYTNIFNDDIQHYGEVGVEPELITLERSTWSEARNKLQGVLEEINKENPELLKNTTVLLPHIEDKKHLDIEAKYVNEVTITSISRFKGLESDIVVLVVPNLDELEATYVSNPKTLLYVGLSRARVNLFFLCGTEVSNYSNWKL